MKECCSSDCRQGRDCHAQPDLWFAGFVYLFTIVALTALVLAAAYIITRGSLN